jgi:hypothetical protein
MTDRVSVSDTFDYQSTVPTLESELRTLAKKQAEQKSGYKAMSLLPLATRQSVMVDGPNFKLALPEIVVGVIDAVKAPIGAWRGEFDPDSPEGVMEALNLATNVFGGSVVTAGTKPVKPGTLNMMAGRGAATWDQVPVTQKFRGVEGRAKFEIPDVGAKLDEEKLFGSIKTRGAYWKLEEIFDHPELYKAYPQLRNLPVKFDRTPETNFKGRSGPPGIEIDIPFGFNELKIRDITSVLLHEIQHIIQDFEKFAGGTSPSWINNFATQKTLGITKISPNQTLTAEDIIELTMKEFKMPASERATELARLKADKDYVDYFGTVGEGDARLTSKRYLEYNTLEELMKNPIWQGGVQRQDLYEIPIDKMSILVQSRSMPFPQVPAGYTTPAYKPVPTAPPKPTPTSK